MPEPLPEVLAKRIVMVPCAELKPHPKNANHGDVEAIRESIRTNGVFAPVLVQQSRKRIIAHKHVWDACVAEGLPRVPVVWLDVNDKQAERIMVADNRTRDIAQTDDAALLALLQGLAESAEGLFGTGYTDDGMDVLRARVEGANVLPAEAFAGDFAGQYVPPEERGGERTAGDSAYREIVVLATEEQRAEWVELVNAARARDGAETPIIDLLLAAMRLLAAA